MTIFTMNSGVWRTPEAINRELAANYIAPTPTTGTTVNVPNTVTDVNLLPAAPLLVLTINFPPSPYDGQSLVISSTQTITTLTLLAAIGVVQNLVTTITLGSSIEYKYLGGSKNIWVRKR